MIHRHLKGQTWSLMAIESLLERGKLRDWQNFGWSLKDDPELALAALRVADGPVDEGSAELARALIFHVYPQLRQKNVGYKKKRGQEGFS
ncbi:MAG: hypothetical protein IT447_09910 [Phycisphaerales bacterium]|jgi:hypothetical protein|nr:hypothetical protein [Phycisphaerales bacterium]